MPEPFDPYLRWLGIRDPERPLISTGDQGLEVVKVLDAIRRSAQARHEVAIAG